MCEREATDPNFVGVWRYELRRKHHRMNFGTVNTLRAEARVSTVPMVVIQGPLCMRD